jgi:hypothetical protein
MLRVDAQRHVDAVGESAENCSVAGPVENML